MIAGIKNIEKLNRIRKIYSSVKSKHLIFGILIFWLAVISFSRPWKNNLIVNDIVSYYGYLPAAIIHQDLTLKFTEKDKDFYSGKYWPETAPNGGKVIKTTMGLSLLYAPFFIVGHMLACLFNQPRDGFSTIYQASVFIGCLFYLLAGFYFLRKLLLFYFSDRIVSYTIFSVFFATNLFWYSTFYGLMAHLYVFSLTIFFIYQTVKWHNRQQLKTAALIGLCGGLLILIRPTMVMCFLVYLLFGIQDRQSLQRKIHLLRNNLPQLLLMGACALLLISPQLFYWKYITGNWFFFSYVGERFYFDHPHILEGLIGFRKGWLVYTPVMILAIFGVFRLRKTVPDFFLPVIVIFPLTVYILLSWWAWWYGGGFGHRAFIDFYGLFAIPMAAFYKQALEQGRQIIRIATVFIFSFFAGLNLFQTWQYKHDLIHYDSMTRKAYALGFFALHPTPEWYYALESPNYPRARKGLSEYHSREEIEQIRPGDEISFTSYARMNVSAEIGADARLTANRWERGEWETFSLTWITKNKVVLKAANNKYVSADHTSGGLLFANRDQVGTWEVFQVEFLDKGRIALKADNNKYIIVGNDPGFEVKVGGDSLTREARLRIFIN